MPSIECPFRASRGWGYVGPESGTAEMRKGAYGERMGGTREADEGRADHRARPLEEPLRAHPRGSACRLRVSAYGTPAHGRRRYLSGRTNRPASWAERIALHGTAHPKDGMFYSCDLMDYGLTNDQSYDVCMRLFEERRLELPPNVRFRDIEPPESCDPVS